MSTWRRKAIECLPECKSEFEHPETSIYDVYIEMLPAVIQAHKENNNDRLKKIYDYAEWCYRQKEKDLWNAAGVSFYEHLLDHKETLNDFHKWIKPEIYVEIRELLEWWTKGSEDFKKVDEQY